MVSVDIDENEIKALDDLMKDAKCPVEMGAVLYGLKVKIYKAWKTDFDSKQKEVAQKLLEEEKPKKAKNAD